MKDNKPLIYSTWGYSYAPPMLESEEDKIVLNSNYVMSIICYDAKSQEINEDLEKLQNLKYPSTIVWEMSKILTSFSASTRLTS